MTARTVTDKRVEWPVIELGVAAALLLGAVALSMTLSAGTRAGLVAGDQAGTLPAGDVTTFLAIAGRNLSAALGIFSGVITFGLGSVVFLLLIGSVLGWSIGASADLLGVAETLARSWAYTPLELAGFVVAGAAGLIPVVGLLRGRPVTPYRLHLARSLRWLGLATLLILVAAVAETAAIAVHHLGA